jgi:hypothetical protein
MSERKSKNLVTAALLSATAVRIPRKPNERWRWFAELSPKK